MHYSTLPPDTSDVQTAVVESVNSESLKVTCTFAVGTQSIGCQVQVELTSDNSTSQNTYYTINITRISLKRNTDNPLVAEATVDLRFPSEDFEVIAFDWESDGTISDFGIPVEVIGGPIPPSSAAPSMLCVCVWWVASYHFFHLSLYPLPPPPPPPSHPSQAPTVSPTPSTVITTSESQKSSSTGRSTLISYPQTNNRPLFVCRVGT